LARGRGGSRCWSRSRVLRPPRRRTCQPTSSKDRWRRPSSPLSPAKRIKRARFSPRVIDGSWSLGKPWRRASKPFTTRRRRIYSTSRQSSFQYGRLTRYWDRLALWVYLVGIHHLFLPRRPGRP
jgi:hypothetical protein